MNEATNPRASCVSPSTGALASHTPPLPTRQPAAFTLHGVYQVRAGITVLDGIEGDIPHGEITALVGPSGAGKTSLLRLLNRLDDPVRGAMLYRGRPITDYPVQALRRQVGFVFQTPVMFPGTVRDNLQVALALGGDHGHDAEARMAEAMALAELDRALYARAGDRLSGGQQQRVNIARALMTSPDVLLMDEPTSALDPETAERLMETTRRLSQDQHLTVAMVTHRLAEARRVSDWTIVLERGRIVACGHTADVFERTTDPRIRAFLDTGH
ncbi:MAG TPA: ATP-binding cassette domain-containing protein [Candidatus Tectomicrobia bacterium]